VGATDSALVAGFSRAWPAPTVKLIGGEAAGLPQGRSVTGYVWLNRQGGQASFCLPAELCRRLRRIPQGQTIGLFAHSPHPPGLDSSVDTLKSVRYSAILESALLLRLTCS